jgi:hypothetical protein
LAASYPWYTPYQFAGNMPIWAVDLDGLEPQLYYNKPYKDVGFAGKKTILTKRNANQMADLTQEYNELLVNKHIKVIFDKRGVIENKRYHIVDHESMRDKVTDTFNKSGKEVAMQQYQQLIAEANGALAEHDELFFNSQAELYQGQDNLEYEQKLARYAADKLRLQNANQFTIADMANILDNVGAGAEILGYGFAVIGAEPVAVALVYGGRGLQFVATTIKVTQALSDGDSDELFKIAVIKLGSRVGGKRIDKLVNAEKMTKNKGNIYNSVIIGTGAAAGEIKFEREK